jgi:uncharacterized Zn finger protein (UPF0148 family)
MSLFPTHQGFSCPDCGQFIPTSLHHLIVHGRTACPSCALVLTLHGDDRQQLREAEARLDRVESSSPP